MAPVKEDKIINQIIKFKFNLLKISHKGPIFCQVINKKLFFQFNLFIVMGNQ